DRRERDQLGRLDHPQELEEEIEVPLGPRYVAGGGRVRLGALLGAEDDRHRDDHGDDDQRHRRVLQDRIGEEGLALLLEDLVLLQICLFVGGLHALAEAPWPGRAPPPSTPASSWVTGAAIFGLSARSHGGAVVPSLTTR